jgi:hypothetical protein
LNDYETFPEGRTRKEIRVLGGYLKIFYSSCHALHARFPKQQIIETTLGLLYGFEIGSDSDSKLGSHFGDTVLINLKLLVKVEFDLPSALDLELD